MNNIWFTAAVVVVLVGLVKGEEIKCHECTYLKANSLTDGSKDCKDDPGKLNSVKTRDPCLGLAPFNGIIRVNSNISQATSAQANLSLKANREESVKALGSRCAKFTGSGKVNDVSYEVVARLAVCVDIEDECFTDLPANWEALIPPEFEDDLGSVSGLIKDMDISLCVCDSDECNSGSLMGFSLTLLTFAATYVLLLH